jgi:glycosyltransferase involved in cell wall biosynthesis
MPSFTVIVPALNEESNLGPAVEAILQQMKPLATSLEVLVYDDASTDRTGAVADELAQRDARVRVVHNRERLNIGGIYKAGVQAAQGDYVLLVPGDNEMRMDEIARGIKYLDRADLVVFYVTNVRVRSWWRRRLSRLYAAGVNFIFGTRFSYTNGTNVFKTDIVRKIEIRTNGFSYQTEAIVKAVWSAQDFVQVGIEIKPRESGESKALTLRNLRIVLDALLRLWWEVKVTERGRYRRLGRMLGKF